MRFLILILLFIPSIIFAGENESGLLIAKIKQELREQLNITHAEVVISSAPELGKSFRIGNITFGRETFHVSVEIAKGTSLVKGRFYALTLVPALKVNVLRGALISTEQVHRILVRSDRIPASAILQDELIVGRMARRNLLLNRVLQNYDIKKPTVVRKNSKVSVTYLQNGLRMYLMGVSLEDGGVGDVIKIMNPRSGRGFLALILDENRIEVMK